VTVLENGLKTNMAVWVVQIVSTVSQKEISDRINLIVRQRL